MSELPMSDELHTAESRVVCHGNGSTSTYLRDASFVIKDGK